MADLSSFLPTMPKDLGKVKTARFREIAERNKMGVYTQNRNTLKANHTNITRKLTNLNKLRSKTKKTKAFDEKIEWLTGYKGALETKYPIPKHYWEEKHANTGTYVLELAPMPNGLDISMLRDMVKSYLSHRLDFYKEAKRSLFVEDEFSEWFIEKASGGKQIGKGHIAMDVKTGRDDGVDVFCVIMNQSGSNEKSLIQNFKESGLDLDGLFKDLKFNDAVKTFLGDYKKKLLAVTETMQMHDLYYLGFVSTVKGVYLVNFKINIEHIDHVGVKSVTKGGKSIFMNNFISPKHGNVKLYKSKKRVELRLAPGVLHSPHAVSVFELDKPISNGEGDEEALKNEEVEEAEAEPEANGDED